MKRSLVNKSIIEIIDFMEKRNFVFPPFAKCTLDDWKERAKDSREIIDNMLGWDITDFGLGDYYKTGLLIFTFRNGNFNDKERYPKPYAEKLLIVEDGQELPFHFHWSKMEDIINRGGGNLKMWLYNADEKENFADTDVHITIDGKAVTVPAGGCVTLHPGESVTLKPGQYHKWQGEPGTGRVVLFEVSTTNDDNIDNRFYDAGNRIPKIEEDEAPVYLIFDDYKRLLSI